MFVILSDKTICLTRGDVADIVVSAKNQNDGQSHTFNQGDIIRLCVFNKKDCTGVVLEKDVEVSGEVETVTISLTSADTTIGDIISKPVDYWYNVKLNPDTARQTIIGYDEAGPKVFRLYPEGGDVE